MGVYLQLKDKVYYDNDSVIPISEIGEEEDALLCITDLRECCKKNQTLSNETALGNWFYPNESAVGTLEHFSSDQGFYKNRDRSVVLLHRKGNITVPTGQFCCDIPDATNETVKICIDVINSNNISFPALTSGDEYCKTSSTLSTTSQLQPTSTPLTTEGLTSGDEYYKISSTTSTTTQLQPTSTLLTTEG